VRATIWASCGRDLDLAGGDAACPCAPVVGAGGARWLFCRRLQIKGLGPGSCEGGDSPASFSACRGGQGGRRRLDGAVASSSRPAVVVRGCRSFSSSSSSSAGVRGWYFWRCLVFLLVLCWLHGGGSGSCGGSTGIWCDFKGASFRRFVTACLVPRPDHKGVGHPLPLLQSAVHATSLAALPQVVCSPAVAVVRRLHRDLAGELEDLIAFLYRFFLYFCRAVLYVLS
jgi:hypothetical protein